MANYGFESSDEVKYDTFGFPVGRYTIKAVDEMDTATGIMVVYEVLDGEHINKTLSVYYNTLSDNDITAKRARQDIKRIADATGKLVDASNPITGRVFMVDVELNKKNPLYTNVRAYMPASGVPVSAEKARNDPFNDSVPF